MSEENNIDIPIEILGILSCISDSVIVYKNFKVLFANAEGHLLLEQTKKTVLHGLQFDSTQCNTHQYDIHIPESKEHLSAFCIPTPWAGKQANIAIIKTKQDYSSLLYPTPNTEEIHQQNRNRLDLLFKSAGDGYWDWFIPTASVFFSEGWLHMLGYTSSDIEPSFKSWINLIHQDDLGEFLLIWSDYMDNKQEYFSIDYRVKCKNGNYLWVQAHGIKDLNSNGEIVRLSGFHRNINDRKNNEEKIKNYQENLEQLVEKRTQELNYANQKLELLASQDPLTLLHNRRSFDENLTTQLRASKRNNTPLCLLLMDIDHFKSFNDKHGHQQGDICLKSVADAIQASIYRPTDMAARYGGEEFIIILQDTDIQGAIKVAQNIQKNISQLKDLPVNPYTKKHISLSIGIASLDQTTESNFVNLADKAMYQAKENGRSQICYYSKDLKSVSYIVNNPILEQALK